MKAIVLKENLVQVKIPVRRVGSSSLSFLAIGESEGESRFVRILVEVKKPKQPSEFFLKPFNEKDPLLQDELVLQAPQLRPFKGTERIESIEVYGLDSCHRKVFRCRDDAPESRQAPPQPPRAPIPEVHGHLGSRLMDLSELRKTLEVKFSLERIQTQQ